ncbi:MAG: hypothetical protein RJB62_630 [Pseudomonadota bacterium]|jgi:cell division septation protein DedD
MANYHREVYQPSFEDSSDYDLREDEVEDARARLPLLIVIALLVLASFAGVVWLAYNQGIERGLVEAPAVIAAPETPIRSLPSEDDPNVASTGLKIYDDPVPPDEEAAASVLMPAPVTAAPVVEAPSAAATPAPLMAAPAVTAPAPAAPVVPPPPVASAPAASGAALLQVGAFPSEALALEAWQNFQAEHPAIATGLTQDIQTADLGDRGTWYRVRIGPFDDAGTANAVCERLKAEGGSCFLATP